jgi:hypothetical protein
MSKRKIFIITVAMVICLLSTTMAFAASASYSFKNATMSKPVTTNSFTLAKGTIAKISGTQNVTTKPIGPVEIGVILKVKYELINATTKKSCGTIEIPASTTQFNNIKVGTAPSKGTYYLKVTINKDKYAVSGSGAVVS